MNIVKRSLPAVALAAALLLLSGGLTACGEYAPTASEAESEPPPDDGTDVSEPGDPEEPSDSATDEITPPVTDPPPADDTDDTGSDRTGRQPGERTPSGGSGHDGGTGGTGGSTGGTGGETVSYTWGLPPTDTSVTGNDGPAYGSLRAGCATAISFLSATVDQIFFGFNTPRYTVMYVAGLAHCLGRSDLGNAYFTGAIHEYGDAALDRIDFDPDTFEPLDPQPEPLGYGEPVCDLYRTLLSIRDQVAPSTISCGKPGSTPGHIVLAVVDDPCTFDVDESVSPWPGPGDPPTSVCGPITAERLIAAGSDPSTLFAGYSVSEGGEIVVDPPDADAFAFSAETTGSEPMDAGAAPTEPVRLAEPVDEVVEGSVPEEAVVEEAVTDAAAPETSAADTGDAVPGFDEPLTEAAPDEEADQADTPTVSEPTLAG